VGWSLTVGGFVWLRSLIVAPMSVTLGALMKGLSIMGLAALISTFLTSVGADITTFLGGVSSLLSDRRLKSDVVMVDWSR
jgi:hypothetical protein